MPASHHPWLAVAWSVCVALTYAATSVTRHVVHAQESSTKWPAVLIGAHAHNDYEHKRPLFDALDHGFTSIEADLFLVDGELLVAHHILLVNKQRTLDRLYLEPLWNRFKEQNRTLLPDGQSLTLLIDIKRDGAETYVALDKLLSKYREMLSVTEDGVYKPGALSVVISGDRPIDQIKQSNPRYAGIDGRAGDLLSDEPSSLIPLISENWTNHFQFRGVGHMTDDERQKLRKMVTNAHAHSRRLRFWGTPDYEKMWIELQNAGVDLIGTDDLPRLAKFLRDN